MSSETISARNGSFGVTSAHDAEPVDTAGNSTYHLTDSLGSTVALDNASGAVTDSTTEFTFTGEQNDPNGLEYLRARYYEPGTGRFLSRDPLGGGYPYAGGNPVNMVDPTGLYTICGDDAVWGYICFDSTQVGLGACNSNGDCHLYQGDGSAPGNVAQLVASHDDVCVFANGAFEHCYGSRHVPFTEAEFEFAAPLAIKIDKWLSKGYTQDQIPILVRIDLARSSENHDYACLAGPLSMVFGGALIITGVGIGDPALVVLGVGEFIVGVAEYNECKGH